VCRRINQLNPYDRTLVPDLLKVDAEGTCLAISAKRYVITAPNPSGADREVIRKRSEHGLGAYLDPLSPDRERRDANGQRLWVSEAWTWILAARNNPDAPMPDWAALPAMSRLTVSSPVLWRPFAVLNKGRPYRDQIKPFSFLLVAHPDPLGLPAAVDGDGEVQVRLIAPYESDPRQLLNLTWRNIYDPDGPDYRIAVWDHHVHGDVVIVKSYRDALREYRRRPEHKFHDPTGQPCRSTTRGILQRQHVTIAPGGLRLIGKEANLLDEVNVGVFTSIDEVLADYTDPDIHLREVVLPALGHLGGRELAALCGVDRRTIDRIRRGEATPRREQRRRLTDLATQPAPPEAKS
jgi:hypothetical protein